MREVARLEIAEEMLVNGLERLSVFNEVMNRAWPSIEDAQARGARYVGFTYTDGYDDVGILVHCSVEPREVPGTICRVELSEGDDIESLRAKCVMNMADRQMMRVWHCRVELEPVLQALLERDACVTIARYEGKIAAMATIGGSGAFTSEPSETIGDAILSVLRQLGAANEEPANEEHR